MWRVAWFAILLSGCSSPQYSAKRIILESGGEVVWKEGKVLAIHLPEAKSARRVLSRLPYIDTVKVLNLAATDVTNHDVQQLPDWPLETLSLRGTDITEVCVPRILRFTRLQSLVLSETDITSLEGLSSLPQLETLALPPAADDNTLLAEVSKCETLQTLYAAGTEIVGPGLAACTPKNLPKLQTLYLDRTHLDDKGLLHLPLHEGLQRVTLQATNVGDQAAEHLVSFPRIDFLDFSQTKLTDQGLEHLAKLPLLYILDLDGSQVTLEGMEKLAEGRPNLRLTHRDLTPPAEADELPLETAGTQLKDL